MSLLLHGAEHVVGELAARHVADVQFHHGRAGGAAGHRPHQGVRRVGHAVAAPRAVFEDELDVLARMKLHHVVGRQLKRDAHHVVRQALQLRHAHRHLADRESAGLGDLARFEHHIAVRHAAAGQHVAGGFFLGRQRLALVRPVHHGTLDLLAFAGAAGAVLAAIGQADALADGRSQHRFAGLGGETAPAGLYGDGEAHRFGIL